MDCGYIDEKKEEVKEQVSVSGSRKKTVQELIEEEDNEEEVEQKVQNLFTSSLLHSSASSTKTSSNQFQSARTEIMEVQDDVVQVLTKVRDPTDYFLHSIEILLYLSLEITNSCFRIR